MVHGLILGRGVAGKVIWYANPRPWIKLIHLIELLLGFDLLLRRVWHVLCFCLLLYLARLVKHGAFMDLKLGLTRLEQDFGESAPRKVDVGF